MPALCGDQYNQASYADSPSFPALLPLVPIPDAWDLILYCIININPMKGSHLRRARKLILHLRKDSPQLSSCFSLLVNLFEVSKCKRKPVLWYLEGQPSSPVLRTNASFGSTQIY